MKIQYNKKIIAMALLSFGVFSLVATNGCMESKQISEKNGMQLWSENCQRCHNTVSSNTFSAAEWKTVGMHMQSRAMLTDKERDKIVEFLQN